MWENRSGVQNTLTGVGRDHQGEAFTMWMAGGGIKKKRICSWKKQTKLVIQE